MTKTTTITPNFFFLIYNSVFFLLITKEVGGFVNSLQNQISRYAPRNQLKIWALFMVKN